MMEYIYPLIYPLVSILVFLIPGGRWTHKYFVRNDNLLAKIYWKNVKQSVVEGVITDKRIIQFYFRKDKTMNKKKINVTQKQLLPIIISAVTSSVAVVAVAILIAEEKLFSDFLRDLHNQIDEIEKISSVNPPREEEPKLDKWLKDEKLRSLMKEVDVPDDSEDEYTSETIKNKELVLL